VGALLHAMLPQLANLSLGGCSEDAASSFVLTELAQAAGGVPPLHTLRIDSVNLGAIAPITGSLRKLSLSPFNGSVRKWESESLLAHAQELQELELQKPPPLGCAWVLPSLQKLSLMPSDECCR